MLTGITSALVFSLLFFQSGVVSDPSGMTASAQDYDCSNPPCGEPGNPERGTCCIQETGGNVGTHAYPALNIAGSADCTVTNASNILGRTVLDTAWYGSRNAAVTAIRNTGGTACVAVPSSSSVAAQSSSESPYPSVCGNGDAEPNEQCDQGTRNSNTLPDRCRENCTLPFCGDAVTDAANGELCDDGAENAANPYSTFNSVAPDVHCRPWCWPAECGDGVVDPTLGERCEPNVSAPGTCTQDCQLVQAEAGCGDGVVDPALGEQCEPSVSAPGTCTQDCQLVQAGPSGEVSFEPRDPFAIYKSLMDVFFMGLTLQLANALGIPLN